MRFLNDEEKDIYNINKKEKEELNEELRELGDRITAVDARVDDTNTVIDAIVSSDSCDKANANHVNTTTTNLSAENGEITNLKTGEIENTGRVKTDSIEANGATFTGDITARKSYINQVEAHYTVTENLEADDITAKDLSANNAEFDTIKVNGSTDLGNARIAHFDIEELQTPKADITDLTADEVDAEQATFGNAFVGLIESDKALLEQLQTHNITYHNDPKNPYYIHIEPQDQPSETDYRIIEVPYTDTGDYFLSLRDPVSDQAWWSVIVHNNHSNITVSYSRRTKDFQGNPLTVPTLDEFYIYNYDSEAPKLYIRTYVGGNLYWQNHSLKENPSPVMHNWYPFDISAQGAIRYQCFHTAATWFSHIINIGTKGDSEGDASLFLVPTDWNNASRSQIEFNGERDIIYNFYVPNQSVNTTDEVIFKDLIIDPLDGKWVYNIENALQGIDPVEVTNGQLDAYENLIETKELCKWNGKVGTQGDDITTENGCIYRDQGYEEINQYLYRKVALDSYDKVTYNGTPVTTTLKLVLRRKMNTARGLEDDLVVSAPAVVAPYEDADGVMWTSYTYTFYGEYPEGQMYTVWLERTVEGSPVTKMLESTVNSDEYIINCIGFKQQFSYGTIDLNKYTYNSYHNTLQYLGDVQEGKWDAGDIHVTKKNTPTGNYDGDLEVDGDTTLHGDITLSPVSPEDTTTLTYNKLELVGHKKDSQDEDIPGSNLLIRDDVNIGESPDDIHNLNVSGKITFGSLAINNSNEGDNMRIRNAGTAQDPDMVMIAEGCAELDAKNNLKPEDKLITAETIGDWNGAVNDNNTITYPLTELGNGTQVHGDHFVEKDQIVSGNATVRGNLIVDGSLIAADEQEIQTSSDYAVLRKNKQNGLGLTEKSGVVIHNYDGNGKNASLAVDKDGIFRIADNAVETTHQFTTISNYGGTWITGINPASSASTYPTGAIVSQDADTLSDCADYSGSIYHYDGTNWFLLSIVATKLTYDKTSPITDAATITALNAATKKELVYYRSVTDMTISDASNQPILTRDEATGFWDKAPIVWDATNNKGVAATSTGPTKSKQALISRIDPLTSALTYEWGNASGSGAAFVMTTAEYNTRAAITDPDDEDYIPNDALVIITDADEEYLCGEVEV